MTYTANCILTTAVFVLLDKAAQKGVKSSPKRGVMQAVDRELRVPAPGVLPFIVKGDLYCSSRTSLVSVISSCSCHCRGVAGKFLRRAEGLVPVPADGAQERRIDDQLPERIDQGHVDRGEAADAVYVDAEIETVGI